MKALFLVALLPFAALAAGERAATYEVPVREELKAYATFPMDPVRVTINGGEMSVRYEMPLSLTGVKSEQEFRGLLGKERTELRSAQGTMACIASENACRVKYSYLQIDERSAEAELVRLGFIGPELESKLMVVAALGGDMQGIIRFAPGSAEFRSYFLR